MTQPRRQIMPPLVEGLQEYCSWLRTTPVGPWERVLLIDDVRVDSVPVQPEDFRERWHEIVSTVDGQWVNFAFVGCRAHTLVVSVEWRPQPEEEEARPGRPISVNWGGASAVTQAGVCCQAVRLRPGERGPVPYEMFCPYSSTEDPDVHGLGSGSQGLRIPFSTRGEAEQAVHDHLKASHPYWAG